MESVGDKRRHYCSLLRTPRAPDEISDDLYSALERFTILMYDRTRTSVSINERKLLFTRKGRPMAALPPSDATLHQHIRRATLQGGHDWGAATQSYRLLPSPGDWRWTHPDKWQPLWTNLPAASVSCPELLHRRAGRDAQTAHAHRRT